MFGSCRLSSPFGPQGEVTLITISLALCSARAMIRRCFYDDAEERILHPERCAAT